MKKSKIFSAKRTHLGVFLCSECQQVFFHWRHNTQIALHPLGVVVDKYHWLPFLTE